MPANKVNVSKDLDQKQGACANFPCGCIKNSSFKERLCFGAAFLTFLIILSILIWFVIPAKEEKLLNIGEPPHEWFLTRDMWDALPYHHNLTTAMFDPLKLVVIHHTVTRTCATYRECAETMRAIQRHSLNTFNYDIPYNFLIGNDGRVYEGRGWGIQGAQRADFGRCTVLVGFVGDYRYEVNDHTKVTDDQLNRTRMLFAEGVREGHLQKDFRVIGARDIMYTESPGSLLYEAIQEWEEYDHGNYRGQNCEIIYGIEEVPDDPEAWLISRDMWESREVGNVPTTEPFDPLKLVVIQHTVTTECYSISACSSALRNLQSSAINSGHVDIIYNFVIGNDGRVYEGRGWGKDGAQRFDFNRCSVNIGFIGDYREEIEGHTRVTEAQLDRTRMLLSDGVRLGHLRSDYFVVGARDLMDTASPGSHLYNAIQKWDQYDHLQRFGNMTCEEIYEINAEKNV
ncbi:peptidoglycan recognition protein 3-like [Aricia agestis]|uniref:peptidoglycan recognition protein 3-like n=1 Tax=Aricia agestis TaxID=91739 RepID=UPI001C205025|nr:peptidoglycan recognition protein 3-like [Aricia agestis]